MDPRKKKTEIICRCNNISRQTIEAAIRDGCDTMNKIFDATTAGIGPCGGSCRRKLQPMLNHYLETGKFPDKIVADMTGKEPLQKKEETGDGNSTPDSSDENQ